MSKYLRDSHGRRIWTDDQLVYSAWSRCPCGAGLAYVLRENLLVRDQEMEYWDCSDILTGRAIPKDQPGFKTHTGELPWIFWSVKSESAASAHGSTTRPKCEAVA